MTKKNSCQTKERFHAVACRQCKPIVDKIVHLVKQVHISAPQPALGRYRNMEVPQSTPGSDLEATKELQMPGRYREEENVSDMPLLKKRRICESDSTETVESGDADATSDSSDKSPMGQIATLQNFMTEMRREDEVGRPSSKDEEEIVQQPIHEEAWYVFDWRILLLLIFCVWNVSEEINVGISYF